jgi:hypothetical protein
MSAPTTTKTTTASQGVSETHNVTAGVDGPYQILNSVTTAKAALICYHDRAGPGVEFTFWRSRAEAVAARDELTPCGPRCIGIHTVVGLDPAAKC